MSGEETNVCQNCGSVGVQQFCPACGQGLIREDRSLLSWLRGALDELLSLDGRMVRTLRTLFASPGTLTLAWVAGERARFTPPIKLYLVSSVLFFGVLSVLGTSPMRLLELLGEIEGLRQEEHIRAIAAADPGEWPPDLLRAAAGAYRGFIEDAVTIGLLIVVPATALILALLFLRSRRWYYVDHLIHALHVVSAALLVWAIAWPLFFVEIPVLRRVLAPLIWIALLVYGAISFARVYRLGVLKSAIAYPGMLVLGTVGGLAIFGVTIGEDRAFSRIEAAMLLWDEAYGAYGERVYRAATAPGRSAISRQQVFDLSEVVYEHAPFGLRRLDDHFVTDFADLQLQKGNPSDALDIFGSALSGLRRAPDAVGGAAIAHAQLGDSTQARQLGREFLELLDGGARGSHPERTNRYRLAALRVLGSERPER